MNALVRLGTEQAENWNSLTAASDGAGYSVSESTGNFQHSSRNETILRFIGIVFVLGSLVQWSFPQASFAGDPMTSKALMSVAFTLVGMAVYHFAIRGHRSEIRFDPKKNQILVSALNRQDRQKSTRRIHLRHIKSIYVRRSDMPPGRAALRIRLNDRAAEITAIRGEIGEIELVHGMLCRDIRMAKQSN